jgi:hypothetical protein
MTIKTSLKRQHCKEIYSKSFNLFINKKLKGEIINGTNFNRSIETIERYVTAGRGGNCNQRLPCPAADTFYRSHGKQPDL